MSTQETFKQQTLSLVKIIHDMGNRFLDDTPELLTLDTRNVIDESVVQTVRTVEALGKDQYKHYHQSVMVDCTRSIHEPTKKKLTPPLHVSDNQGQDQARRSDVKSEG